MTGGGTDLGKLSWRVRTVHRELSARLLGHREQSAGVPAPLHHRGGGEPRAQLPAGHIAGRAPQRPAPVWPGQRADTFPRPPCQGRRPGKPVAILHTPGFTSPPIFSKTREVKGCADAWFLREHKPQLRAHRPSCLR